MARRRPGEALKMVKSMRRMVRALSKSVHEQNDVISKWTEDLRNTRRRDTHQWAVPYIQSVAYEMVLWFTGKRLRDSTDEESGNFRVLAREAGCKLEDVEIIFQGVVENRCADEIQGDSCVFNFRDLQVTTKECVALFRRHPSLIPVLTNQYRLLQYRDLILKEISRTIRTGNLCDENFKMKASPGKEQGVNGVDKNDIEEGF